MQIAQPRGRGEDASAECNICVTRARRPATSLPDCLCAKWATLQIYRDTCTPEGVTKGPANIYEFPL